MGAGLPLYRLGDRLDPPFLAGTRGFDHNFVLRNPATGPAAVLSSPETGVALELDSGSAMLCGSNMNNSRFLRNGVAIRVKRLPVEWMTLDLYDCSFYGNTVDLDDPQGLVVRR